LIEISQIMFMSISKSSQNKPILL